jgi:hypothetical protein
MFRARDVFVVAVAVLVLPDAAQAQPAPGVLTPPRPTYSPYLNLVRRDAPAGVNYYGLVRPQIALQNNLQALQQQILAGQQLPAAGVGVVDSGLPVTGQQTFFFNTGGYFLNNRAGSVPVTSAGTTRSAPLAPTVPMVPRPQTRTR